MNPIKQIIGNFRHKECVKAFECIKKDLSCSNRPVILYIATKKGYDELFEKIKNEGWDYRIDGNNSEGVFLTVKGTMKREN